MKAVIFGSDDDYRQLIEAIPSAPTEAFPKLHTYHFDDYDDLRNNITDSEYELVIILASGAQGMEACLGVRRMRPAVPVFWFSDDPYFAPQSYRMNCTYFSTKPITEHKLCHALDMLTFGQGDQRYVYDIS